MNLYTERTRKKTRMALTPKKISAGKHRFYSRLAARYKTFVGLPAFAKGYIVVSLAILLASTIFWSLLSARIQTRNADQLVNTYMFQHPASLSSAIFPGVHTMLFKWPLFELIKVFGVSSSTFVTFTVITVLATVALLAYIIYRIERRPLIFGTICLGLASVLLLVPTQPYAGGLLPVNMAMIATRNLEYILYVAAVLILIRSPSLRSPRFWLAVVLMSLLTASDRLFLMLSIGGALLALVVYALSNGWNLVSLTARWLLGGLAAGIGGVLILWGINKANITHVSAQTIGPYGLVHGIHDLGLGVIFASLGLFTNFGANPASSATVLREIPGEARVHLISISGLTFVINVVILVIGLFAVWHVVAASLVRNKNLKAKLDTPYTLSLVLIWTSIAGIALFALSNHDYAVDARYLTIALFAVFISLASYARQQQWRPEIVSLAGLFIILGILLALPTVVKAYNNDKAALAPTDERNSLIVKVLKSRPVDELVGDYWRVMPTKLASGGKLNVVPLSGCTQFRSALTSQSWQPNLSKHSFAYLLTLDGSLTDYPNCTLDQVVTSYGRPNASVLIAGSLTKPKELLLFYDHGAHKSAPVSPTNPAATVLPITLDELPHTYCSVPTVMSVVAHEDDDLLFMNPDLSHDLKAGHCVRTIYITAGDSGASEFYWLAREQGSEAAYANMLGIDDIWVQRIVKLTDQEFIAVANPRGNANVSLIFFHLPDGNTKGQGFSSSNFQSLAKLESGAISVEQSVDGQSSYTLTQLIAALTSLMHAYQPAEIRTQSGFTGSRYRDHSDHIAVGSLVKKAYSAYEAQQYEDQVAIPLEFYIGYPVHERPANVFGSDLAQKEATFLVYSKFDGGACQSLQQCLANPAYNAYLTREYQNSY